MSSECASFAFLTCVTALERTLLSESLALLPSCLATLARFSLCSRVTLQGNGKNVRNERQNKKTRVQKNIEFKVTGEKKGDGLNTEMRLLAACQQL